MTYKRPCAGGLEIIQFGGQLLNLARASRAVGSPCTGTVALAAKPALGSGSSRARSARLAFPQLPRARASQFAADQLSWWTSCVMTGLSVTRKHSQHTGCTCPAGQKPRRVSWGAARGRIPRRVEGPEPSSARTQPFVSSEASNDGVVSFGSHSRCGQSLYGIGKHNFHFHGRTERSPTGEVCGVRWQG